MNREALKLALEALKDNQHLIADNERHAYVMEYNSIIEKCEKALAQQSNEQVEPVAISEVLRLSKANFIYNFGESEAANWIYADIAELLEAHPPVPTAQPKEPEQEPVAWRHSLTCCLFETEEEVPLADGDEWAEPLYTTPPQRKPLTEQEIWDAVQHGVVGSIGFVSRAVAVARAIEAAHGIKE